MNATERLAAALSGRYRLERELGAGGMATVYLAHDLRHDRDVAIKVLHADLAAALGAERFLAEIKTTARLQHPHILPLLDSGEAAGLLYYVMPYVAGESLRDRLTREKQLPIEDAERIAREVADALGHAHAHGIIHRDIKPENILLQEGHALVADFGIALAVQSAGGQRMTQTGLSLGTPQYMSPEQAMGEKAIDARADVYALGAVTYEMLTGEPPFTGATVQAIVAKVLSERPTPPSMVRDTVPPHVEAAVLRALAKLPADRHANAAEFARALDAAPTTIAASVVGVGLLRSRLRRQWTPLTTLAAAAALVAGSFALWRGGVTDTPSPAMEPMRFAIVPPAGFQFDDVAPAVSADGSMLAFVADSATISRIFVRRLADVKAMALAGTEDRTGSLVLSPDGRWVMYQAVGRLMRVPSDGSQLPSPVSGSPSLAPIGASGFDWADDGSVVLVADLSTGLLRLDPSSGRVDTLRLVRQADGEFGIQYPAVLPKSRHLLFGLYSRAGWTLMGRAVDGSREVSLVAGAASARFAEPDLLIYSKAGTLYATRFDPEALRLLGEPVAISSRLPSSFIAASHAVHFAMSRNGVLVHLAGMVRRLEGELTLVERDGSRPTPLREARGTRPRFSGDGRSIVAEDSGQAWIYDLTQGGTRTRVSKAGMSFVCIWSPDGARIVTSSYDGGPAQLWLLSLSMPDESHQLRPSTRRRYASSFTPDGRTLAFVEIGPDGPDIWTLTDDSVERPVLRSRYAEQHPRLSPDGRFLAFTSDESGRDEVYLQGYPDPGQKVRLSLDGGSAPVWAPSGRELFFLKGEEIFSRSITGGLPQGEPHPIARVSGMMAPDAISVPYDISPDGRQFVVTRAWPITQEYELHVVLGFRPPVVGSR